MTTLFSWDDGAVPSGVVGSTFTSDGSVGYPASPGLLLDQDDGQACYFIEDFGSQAELAVRTYFHTPASWPSLSFGVLQTQPFFGDFIAGIRLGGTGAPGQVRLARGANATETGSALDAVVVDTTYRFELWIDTASSQARALVFPVLSDSALYDSGWHVHADFAVQPDRLIVGLPNVSPAVDVHWYDSIEVTDTAELIGRHPADTTDTGPTMTYWDGSTETPVTMTYWDGSTETPVTMEAP